jgi:hypothetical protein
MLCIAQIVAPLILVLAEAIDYISFEKVRYFYIPYLLASVIGFSPFVVLAFIPKFRNDVQAKLFAATASLVFGIQGLVFLTEVNWVFGFLPLLMYLSIIASVSGIALVVLLVLDLKINKSMLASMAERWRAVPAFLAVLFLLLESPGRVLEDSKPLLSLILFPVIVGACFLQERYRQGAVAGLAIVIIGSLIGRVAFKILSSYGDGSFISIPSFLALGCCLVVIAPNSIFQQKQTSVRL